MEAATASTQTDTYDAQLRTTKNTHVADTFAADGEDSGDDDDDDGTLL